MVGAVCQAFDRGLVCVGVEDHHVGAVGLLGLVGHDAVSGLEHRHVGVDVVVVGQTQRVDLLAQLDQALDVVDGIGVLGGAVPIDGVHRVARVVAVAVSALGAQELLAELDRGDAFRQIHDGVGKLGTCHGRGVVIRRDGLPELVVQGHVVVDFGIVDHLSGIGVVILRVAVPAGRGRVLVVLAAEHVVGDQALLVGLAGNETGVGVGEHGSLQAVTHGIVEERDAVVRAVGRDLVRVRLDGHLALVHGGVHIPAFAEDDDGRVDLVERCTHFLHRFGVDQTHEIESEAVDVVVLRPIRHRIDDVLAHHLALGGRIVAAAGVVDQGTVVIITEVVAGNGLVERVVGGIVDVVVHHIHDHANVVLVQSLDHLLHFGDARGGVGWIGGIRAFRHVVVLRIVAPVLRTLRVVAQIADLINGTVVVHRHDLHVADAQLLEIVKTGGGAVRRLRSGFHNTQILAPLVGGDSGIRVDGEVADVHFGDGGVSGLAEFRHAVACGAHVFAGEHHGTFAVGDRSGRVRVGGDVHRAVREGELVGVGRAASKVLHQGAPHTLVFRGHVDGLVDFGIHIVGLVGDKLNLGGGWSPHLESGLRARVSGAQIVAVIGVLLVEGIRTHHRARDGVLRTEALDFDGVLASHVKILGRGDDHLGAVGLDVLDIYSLAVGVSDGDLAFKLIRSDLFGQSCGQLVDVGDFNRLHGRSQRWT